MTFVQQIEPCAEHDSCTVIVGTEGRTEAWRSHMASAVHPSHRINPEHKATDDRGRTVTPTPWCNECEPYRREFVGE